MPAAVPVQPSMQSAPAAPVISAVALRSEPSGATVMRDGKRIGETPLSLRVPSDQPFVRVELRRSGYQPLAAELTPRDGTRTFELAPLKPARAHKGHRVERVVERAPASDTPAEPSKPAGPYERFE